MDENVGNVRLADNKYATRLECVKQAVKDELFKLKNKSEDSSPIVGLVTFSSIVEIMGDCSK